MGRWKLRTWFASSTCAYFCPKSQVKRDMSTLGKGRTYSIACLRCIQCHNIAYAEDLPRILPLSKALAVVRKSGKIKENKDTYVIYTVLGEHSVIVAAVGNWKVTRKALARAGNGLR